MGTLTVGAYRDDEHNPKYLLLQRALDGEEDLYVEVNDQAFGAYGAVQEVKLLRSSLHCSFRPEVDLAKRMSPHILIGFGGVPQEKVRDFAHHLERVCLGAVKFVDGVGNK